MFNILQDVEQVIQSHIYYAGQTAGRLLAHAKTLARGPRYTSLRPEDRCPSSREKVMILFLVMKSTSLIAGFMVRSTTLIQNADELS
jgi:hypothetical protein